MPSAGKSPLSNIFIIHRTSQITWEFSLEFDRAEDLDYNDTKLHFV
jgi:hypothetical protein